MAQHGLGTRRSKQLQHKEVGGFGIQAGKAAVGMGF